MRLTRLFKRDETYLVLAASVVSILSFLYFYLQGTTLGYKDMYSHLEIGRRIIVGESTGFGQLGGIWLPLQHILMIPLVWNDFLYLTGLAGSLLSMGAFVTSIVALYKIINHLTGSRVGGYVAAAIFGLNPNVLYLQSTAMTELIMYATTLLAMWGILLWLKTDQYNYLLLAAFATFALSLTRYEGWVLAVVFVAVVLYGCIRKRYALFSGDQKGQGLVLAFAFFALLGILGWMGWNWLIFNDPLNWMKGEYSSSEQVSTQVLSQVGDLGASIMTYYYAMIENIPLALLLLAAAGLVVILVREKLSAESAVVLSVLVIIPFFMYGLFSGQQPMHVEQIDGDLYNLRFGVFAVLPVSLLIGYVVAQAPKPEAMRSLFVVSGGAIVATFSVAMLALSLVGNGDGIITQREARSSIAGMQEQKDVADFLSSETQGRILMESFNNERALFDVQSRVIYEGAEFLWSSSLVDPTGSQNRIDVIVMRTMSGNTDKVFEALHEVPVMFEYEEILRTDHYLVYEKKGQLFSDEISSANRP